MEDYPRLLGEIPCSQCAGAGLELADDGGAVCRFCGAHNTPGAICAQCQTVNRDEAEACANCKTALFSTCPACRSRNWSGRRQCFQCGTQLDAITYMVNRFHQGSLSGQQQQLRELRELKASESEAARRRSEVIDAQEQRRQAALAEARRQAQAREQRLLTFVFIGVGALVVLVLIGVVLSLLIK